MLDQNVPPDHISWVTVVIDVCEPAPKDLRGPMSKFRCWLTEAADKSGVAFFGRSEIDLLLNPRVEPYKKTLKREMLLWLGLESQTLRTGGSLPRTSDCIPPRQSPFVAVPSSETKLPGTSTNQGRTIL